MPRHNTYLRGEITLKQAGENLVTAVALIGVSKKVLLASGDSALASSCLRLVEAAGVCEGTAALVQIKRMEKGEA